MLNGDANENGNKINGYNKQKKQIICTCSTLFCTFHCRCFLQMQCRFARLKSNFLSTHYFLWSNCPMCSPKILVLEFLFTFIFFTAAHFHLAGRKHFSFVWPPLFSCFSSNELNSSPLFSVTRSSSFYVIQVRVDIKNNVKKDSTLFLFFLSKSLGWLCDFPPKLKTPRVNCLWCHTC